MVSGKVPFPEGRGRGLILQIPSSSLWGVERAMGQVASLVLARKCLTASFVRRQELQ